MKGRAGRGKKIAALIAAIVIFDMAFIYGLGLVKDTRQEETARSEEPSSQPIQQEESVFEPVEPETTTTTEETIEQMEKEEEIASVFDGRLPASADDFIMKEDADAFFQNSVFVGDSVMKGLFNYVMVQEEGFLNSPQFLVSGSYSLFMALSPVSKHSLHPVYQGKQRMIWESMEMMGAEKAFLFFGLNDIKMEGVDASYNHYLELINKIREVLPEIELYVISTTNMLTESQTEELNNESINLLNAKMKGYCELSGTGYIDIASFLVSEDGGLRYEYSSDDYVHLKNDVYAIWIKVLRGYASGGNFYVREKAPEKETVTNGRKEENR